MQHQEEFLFLLATEKGLSPHTVAAYKRDLSAFASHLKGKDLSSLSHQDLLSFLEDLQQQKYASSTIARMTISLRLFFRFLQSEGKISKEQHFEIDCPKIWQSIPDILSFEEIQILFSLIDISLVEGKRDRAIIELLYSAALRVSEICSLNLFDVDDKQIKVKGKGGKERIVPISKTTIPILNDYLECRPDSQENNPPLFLTPRGKRIDRFFVFHLIKDLQERAKLTKNISPHTLRHSAATHLLENGADIRIIQEILGHAHISTTERYTHISKTHLKEALLRCHPRD